MSRRPRPPVPTPAGWVLLIALMVLLAGLCLAVNQARAQEVDAGERYSPASRSGRQAVVELAEASFAPEWVAWAVRVAGCESGWDVYAHSSGYDRRLGVWYSFWGALQVDAVTWGAKARELFGGELSEPSVNFAMASWIVTNYGPSHWPWCGR